MNDLISYYELNAGVVKLFYKNGWIRKVRNGHKEVLRAVYPALRDQNWGTIPMEIIDESVISDDKSFHTISDVSFINGNINFGAQLQVTGKPNEILEYRFSGKALNTFIKNRIGLNILFPLYGYTNRAFEIMTTEGQRKQKKFPEIISPHQPAKKIKEIYWKMNGLSFEMVFEGDAFEMEDQRNWTDGSYKIYSTPLELPFPVEIKKGDTIFQKVIFKSYTKKTSYVVDKKEIQIEIHDHRPYPLPNIGYFRNAHKTGLTEREISILRELKTGHYRTDVYLHRSNREEVLLNSTKESERLHTPLYLTLHFSSEYQNELSWLLTYAENQHINPKWISLFDEKTKITSDNLTKHVLPAIKHLFPDALFGCGVDAYFAELNRTRPDAEKYDFITYSICPQIHANDNLSLIENLEGQGPTVQSAAKIYPGYPVHISPVTLNQRFNVVAVDENQQDYPLSDKRQCNFFNAMWTLISIKNLTQDGAAVVTYFESTGPRGLIKVPGTLSAKPPVDDNSITYPIYHIMKYLLAFDHMVPVYCSNHLHVNGTCFTKNGQVSIIMVNFSESRQSVKLKNVVDDQETKNTLLRTITEKNVHEAIASIPYKKIDVGKHDVVELAPQSITLLETITL